MNIVNWLNLSRGALIIALLLFLSPWMAVSCNGAPLAQATGADLIVGRFDQPRDSPLAKMQEMAPPSERGAQGPISDDSPGASEVSDGARLWAPAALVLIGLGLAVSFALTPRRRRGLATMAAALAAIVVLGAGMTWTTVSFSDAMRKASEDAKAQSSSSPEAFGAGMAEAVLQGIRLDIRPGYWLTLIALAMGAGAGWMALNGRGLPGITISVAPSRPDEDRSSA